MLKLPEPEMLRAGLLAWFDRCRRDLPWRRSEEPYEILVAEVMLQQTRSEVVAARYQGFLARFPTLAALSSARASEVEAAWTGLGYYRRARNLHRAAGILAERGAFPGSAAEWMELPGVGAYTSALLASRCNGEPAAVLDGNVERVLSRFLASPLQPKRAEARRRLLATAGQLLDPCRPGDSNQALMEVGSLVCRRRRPECGACPLAPGCRAFQAPGLDPRSFPVAGRRRARETVVCYTAVVQRGPKLLLHRRPADAAWLAGRWQLPTIELGNGRESPCEAAELLAEEFGGTWECEEDEVEVRHAVTYRDFVVRAALARWCPGRGLEEADESASSVEKGGLAWFGGGEIEGLPSSSLLGKTLARLSERGADLTGSAGAPRVAAPIHSGP